jgi:hypothetical protein
LTSKGFYVASNSVSNYPLTSQSLASSLNLEYINYLGDEVGEDSSDRTVVYPMLKGHEVQHFLKSRGYDFINIGSWWEPTRTNKFADKNLSTNQNFPEPDEFSTKLLDTTAFSPIAARFFPEANLRTNFENKTLDQLQNLEETAGKEGPKFVFAHILLPHVPYVFGRDCEPIGKQEAKKRSRSENYLNQLICTNKKIRHLVDQLLSKSDEPPIIVIQSDEGPYPANYNVKNNFNLKDATKDDLRKKLGILNAYFLPGVDSKALYNSITPVNSFRLIFNLYFDTTHELLPDKNYVFEDIKHLYKFIDVTDKIKAGYEE